MYKIIVFALLLTFSVSSFSQTNEPAPMLKADYLKKARNQKTTAWILLCSGAVISSTGLIVEATEATAYLLTLPGDPEPEPTSNTGGVLMITGAVIMASSIPFFGASAKNKKMAATLSFKNERSVQVYNRSYVSVPVPSISLKITL